jgi:4-amino-4-deoxy-L-arabinose transferase-like glycosyltransferase
MKPTRWPVLVLITVVTACASYAVTRSYYDTMPRPKAVALVWLAIFVIAEFYIAVMTRARLSGRQGTKPIDPLLVARFVALAKASSIVGSLFAGGYGGFLIWVAKLNTPSGGSDTRIATVGVILALAWIGTALFLEYVCRVPKRDDDDEPTTREL